MKSKILALVVAVAMLTVGATGAVAAHNGGNDVGASGHCSDGSGDGGGGSVGASTDGSVDATNSSEVQSVVSALVLFGEKKQSGENSDSADTCDGGEGENSYDYLEAHAGNGDTQAQYCFSEDNSNDNGDAGEGDQCHD